MRLWLTILASMMLMLSGCGSDSGGGPDVPEGMHLVKYEVSTGKQNTLIIYRDENGVDQEITDIDTHSKPWTYTFTAAGGAHLDLTAQLLGDDADTVRVYIYVDYLEANLGQSYGTGVLATCAYDIPPGD